MSNINDISNNSPFNPLNYSYNRNKVVLERCRDKINVYLKNRENVSNITKDLNTIQLNFTMKVDNILNKIKRERDEINNKNILKICDYLDNTQNKHGIQNKYEKKNNIFSIHENIRYINNKYKSIHSPLNIPSYNKYSSNFIFSDFSNPVISKSINIKNVNIDVEINILSDLIKLCDDYPIKYDVKYNINMKSIHNIRSPLEELDNMIGMNRLKKSILNQILYFIQDFNKINKNDYMHTVIYGPPGTGKTEVAKIMGKIFCHLGGLEKQKFKKVTRSDLIAGYLGQTALKTNDVIKECLGGVLFIDEAYALGNSEKRDSFSKECIDTLCEALSNYKDNLMVIIAGYETDLKKCFFDYNKGLESRFTWRFHTDDYSAAELKQIFVKKVKDIGWSFLDKKIKVNWFEKNLKYFKYFGRDIETLLSKVKIVHSRRVFCKNKNVKTKISIEDLDNGLQLFLENNENRQNNDEHIINSLYC